MHVRSLSGTRRIVACGAFGLVAGCSLLTKFDGLASVAPYDGGNGSPDVVIPDASNDAGDASPCLSLASGLIGHWRLDSTSINGTRVADSSGRENNAILIAADGGALPVPVPGRIGEAVAYPATGGGCVSVPVLSLDERDGAVNTVSFWFYRSRSDGDGNDALVYLPESPTQDLWLLGNSLCFNAGSSICWGIDYGGLYDRWVHVAALFHNGPTIASELYIDGARRDLTCKMGPCASVTISVRPPAAFGGCTNYFFRGKLEDPRIWSRALTEAEIIALYDGRACP